MDVEVKVMGLDEAQARMLELGALAGEKLLTRVLRKIAKPMKLAAQQNAANISSSDSNSLASSITVAKRRAKGKQVARVVVTSKAKTPGAIVVHNQFYKRQRKGIWYGWLVEEGHRIGTRTTGYLRKNANGRGAGGNSAGRVEGRRWWAPAVSANEGRAASDFVRELQAALARAEKRKAKTANTDALVPE